MSTHPESSERPASACATHRPPRADAEWRRTDGGLKVCYTCVDRMVDLLLEIPARYSRLDPTPGSPPENRRAPGFGSAAPGSLHIMSLRDARTVQTQPGEVHSVPGLLLSWVENVVDGRGYSAEVEKTVPSMAGFLKTQLEWICEQDWVADFHAELSEVRNQLRTATGEPKPPIIGRCIEIVNEDTLQRCKHPLRGTPPLSCNGCGSYYTGDRILRMQYVNQQEDQCSSSTPQAAS